MLPWFIIVWLPSSQLIHINSKDHSTRTAPNNLRSLRSRWDLREDGWMYTDKACSMALNLCLPAQQAGRTSAGQLVQSYKLAFTYLITLLFLRMSCCFSPLTSGGCSNLPWELLWWEQRAATSASGGPVLSPFWYQQWGEEPGNSSRRQINNLKSLWPTTSARNRSNSSPPGPKMTTEWGWGGGWGAVLCPPPGCAQMKIETLTPKSL